MWFRTGPTQTGLYKHRRWLETGNLDLESRELYYMYICVAKTKALISFAVTAKLICVFVLAYADHLFSHEAAQMLTSYKNSRINIRHIHVYAYFEKYFDRLKNL